MRCRIVNPNLKIWSKVVHMLSTTGDEDIHFSFTDGTMTMTAYDVSLASCVTCTFFKNFFVLFDVPRDTDLMFTIPSKRMLKPFRSMKFLTKGCTFCEIKFAGDAINIIVGCRSGAEIQYNIPKDATSQHLEDASDPRNYKTAIRTDPKLIIGSLTNFTHSRGLVNLTLKVEEGKILLKSCPNERVKKEGKLYTEMRLNAVDFDDYDVKEDCELTVPIREIKMIAGFAEHLKIPMYMHFQTSADPVILQLHSDFLQATMTLATRSGPAVQSQSSEGSSTSNRISAVSSQGSAARNKEVGKATLGGASRNMEMSRPNTAVRSNVQESPAPSPIVAFPIVINDSPIEPIPSENESPVIIMEPPQRRINKSNEGRPPPRKKLRDLFPNIGQPFDVYAAFPGHNQVLVGASDEED